MDTGLHCFYIQLHSREVISNNTHQSAVEVMDHNCDEQSICFPPADTTFDGIRLPPLQRSLKNTSRKKLNVKPKVQTRFPRPDVKKHAIRIPFTIHNGFTLNERRIIKNALKVVASCFMNPENLGNMYHICGTLGYFLGENVWERSLLDTHQINHDYHYLLRYQLMCLKVASEKKEFPAVNVYPIYEKTDVLGEGIVGCVSCKSYGSIVLNSGEFIVYLNRYYLGARGRDYTNTVFWAGVIVHEMLHNLGHTHDEHDMSNRWQINAFERCFVHNSRCSL